MKKTVLFVALAAVMMVMPFLTTGSVFAFMVATGPDEVQLTGTLYNSNHKNAKGTDTLSVFIRHKQMGFKVEDARDITGDASKLDILEAIFPPKLVIEGSSDTIALLQKPEMEGKLITMEGYLYISSGMFNVTRTWKGKK
ncbi:MAG: hypothetical protein JRF71_13820 [Deltaproteobacteria bacterium]|nr:hypothetical protein [Deltaproteobacteria bacterium]